MEPLSKAYEPQKYEDIIYKRWEESGFFNPDNLEGESYSIMMPPPNVTGVLHLGHALENTLMDTMARFQRMRGKKVLLLPGTDHAAVATQAKVEKILIEKGMSQPREVLGREGLLKEIRTYSEQSKATILSQIRKMGTSCDWSRLAYTFDEARNQAVNEMFVRMYNDGLIYRGYRVVNWSVRGQSTCSDDELEYVERPATLYTFRYSKDFPITIASTRPETKLGDTAVAVHPTDERYAEYIGKTFTVDVGAEAPLQIRVIADEAVDKNFGTGALGVTPAHSSIDFEMYEKQKLQGEPIGLIQVIGVDGKMTAAAGGAYAGKTVEEARELFVVYLKENGLMEKEEDIVQNVGTSDRFKDVVEALPMTQWFVAVNKEIPGRTKTLKGLMKEAVAIGHNGDSEQKVAITPKRFEQIYYHWIDHLRDWCISRQIWWGHRIPVWSKKNQTGIEMRITYFVHEPTWVDVPPGMGFGTADLQLSAFGRAEAGKCAIQLRETPFDIVITSDFPRAKETAQILFGHRDIPIIEDVRLRECDYGELNGAAKPAGFSEEQYIFSPYPSGDSCLDIERRMAGLLSDIMDKYPGKRIAVIGHKFPQFALEVLTQGMSWKQVLVSDWRKKTPPQWQLGWGYAWNILTHVGHRAPEGTGWERDPDTLDTWFSSGTWTFSTLGWPEKTADLNTFHPTDWMQMGHEILFFWMARMILMSTYALDEIPFKDVYIHGLLRNEQGKKFSKSDGNTADPLDSIATYGTDALRYSIVAGITPGNDSRFYKEKIEGARNLVNKLWNMSRFILMTIETPSLNIKRPEPKTLTDEWMLARLDSLVGMVTKDIEGFLFSSAAEQLRDFTWNDLADWYLEIAKVEGEKSDMLNYVLNTMLKLWHPFMPFVTEAIWQEVYGDNEMLMIASWPVTTVSKSTGVTVEFDLLRSIVTGIRSLRSEYHIDPAKKVSVTIHAGTALETLVANMVWVERLARIEKSTIEERIIQPPQTVGFVAGEVAVYVHIGDAIDVEKEKVRLQKELESVSPYIASLEKKLTTEQFVAHAPGAVVETEKKKLEEAKQKSAQIQKQLASLK